MDNLTNQILSTIADSYDAVRPGLGDCVRERIAATSQAETQQTSSVASIRQQQASYTSEGEPIQTVTPDKCHAFMRDTMVLCALPNNHTGNHVNRSNRYVWTEDEAQYHKPLLRPTPSLDFSIAQLAAVRQALLEVIDDQHWDMWETKRIEPGEVKVSVSYDEATEARMKFVDAVQETLREMIWDEQNSKEQAK